MSILQKLDDTTSIFVQTDDSPVEDLLTREWLLTNGRGSYASSTIACCNSRAYHGLLIGSLRPPANRVMALANCLEMVICGSEIFNISTFEFSDKFAPAGFGYLKRFRQNVGVHFDYSLGKAELTKSVYLLRDRDVAAVVYDFTSLREPVEFVARPFVGLRDFHSLQKSYAQLCSRRLNSDAAVIVRHDMPHSCELLLTCPDAKFEKDEQWWLNFVYRVDGERGQNFTEDLWTPGFFKCRVDSPMRIVLWAELADGGPRTRNALDPSRYTAEYFDTACEELYKHQEHLIQQAKNVKGNLQFPISGLRLKNSTLDTGDPDFFETLCLSADAFITRRQSKDKSRTTILAGYPWFADWGRDALISLPGLLLVTGRFEEAKSVLTTFAAAADEGMIPNRFDDYSDTTYFNSVDASVWFINAAFQYLQASGDSKTFTKELIPTIRWIVESYHKGTRYGISADSDGLITAGDNHTQLTWMDAKFDGVAFTPRCGKAVEVNALWYNGLRLLAEFYAGRSAKDADHYKSMADKVGPSFCRLFWNEKSGYLNDCILPNGSVDESFRPNQIFAVSLPYSPLDAGQQKSVVARVQKYLLTPYGLRTLNTQSPNYKGEYSGPPRDRDEAYHQGTVWAFLMGAFVDAYLKVNDFSPQSKVQAAEFILPLLQHMTESGCLGSVSEIFDGDPPHKPRGCFAQAWSVAELIRSYQLISS